MMSPKQKAARRAEEIENALSNENLSAKQRHELESELGAIADNMSEGCYSNDPDDGIDWSTCPGIYDTPSVNKTRIIKFYCPPMSYKLWYKNDMGDLTYDYHIPPDIMPQYLDKVKKAVDNSPYFIRVNDPNVIGIAPDIEVIDGELRGILKVTTDSELSYEDTIYLQDSLTDRIFKWSIYFESQEIKTDGGDLYVRFYDSNDPILSETAFNNKAYVDQNYPAFHTTKFYFDDAVGCVTMMYYNPDSNAGGQLVENKLHLNVLKEWFDECKNGEEFWNRFDERAEQYLTDIDSPDFAYAAKCFVEEPCGCSGESQETIDAIRDWTTKQYAGQEQSHGMDM